MGPFGVLVLGWSWKVGWCRLVGVQTRCWVLRDRAGWFSVALLGWGVVGGWCGRVALAGATCRVSYPLPPFQGVGVCGDAAVGGGWLLVENCTVDASICIFVAFC